MISPVTAFAHPKAFMLICKKGLPESLLPIFLTYLNLMNLFNEVSLLDFKMDKMFTCALLQVRIVNGCLSAAVEMLNE